VQILAQDPSLPAHNCGDHLAGVTGKKSSQSTILAGDKQFESEEPENSISHTCRQVPGKGNDESEHVVVKHLPEQQGELSF